MSGNDQVLDTLKQFGDEVRDVIADVRKSESEKREEFEKRVNDMIATRDAQDREEKRRLADNAPLDVESAKAVTQKGGLFGGRLKLSHRKALEISPDNDLIKGRPGADELRHMQDLHDWCAIRFNHWKKSRDETTAWKLLQRDETFKAYAALLERQGYAKADEILDPGISAHGADNLNFTLLSAQLLDKVSLDWVVAAQFRTVPLTRPQQDFPTLLTDAMGVLGGTSASAPPPSDHQTAPIPAATYFSNPTFGKVSFAVQHCLGYIEWNDDMQEDAVIAWLPTMREQIGRSIARAIDRSILDGDETSDHMDHDVTAATDFRFAFYGLRHMAGVAENGTATKHARQTAGWSIDGAGAAITTTMMRDARAKMGVYGLNPTELRWILDTSSYYEILADGELRVRDKYGDGFTNMTGVIDSYGGVPIVLSEFVRSDLNEVGVDENLGNADRTVAYCVNTTRFMLGRYGQVGIESTRFAPQLLNLIQADVRVDFQPIEALTSGVFASAAAPIGFIYDIVN